MLKLDWGDAQVWMETAEMLYLRNVGNPEGFPRRQMGYPRGNELNVAAVCAGYAFELIFKVLVRAGREELPQAEHEPSVAYGDLAPQDKAEVHRISVKHGWNDPDELLGFLDTCLCDKNRKYWMRPPRGGTARAVFHLEGRKGMVALRSLHKELSALAIERIDDNPDVYEDWPGTSGKGHR